MKEKADGLVIAAFAADSLALGVHWIYNPKKIEEKFGRVESLLPPQPDSFHSARRQGDFTHYGDQMLLLLESVSKQNSFDLKDFSRRWQEMFADYDGYLDGATRKTLANYKKGKLPENGGSDSDDLAGASRIAPLVRAYYKDVEGLLENVRSQTAMTHNRPEVVDSAEFFARVTAQVLSGTAPVKAMKKVLETEKFEISPMAAWVQKGLASAEKDTVEAIGDFGRSCHIGEMFPGVVHLIAKYEDDLKEALVQSVMAGGDSAARGSLVGMVIAAHWGIDDLPEEWIDGMRAKDRIFSLLSGIS